MKRPIITIATILSAVLCCVIFVSFSWSYRTPPYLSLLRIVTIFDSRFVATQFWEYVAKINNNKIPAKYSNNDTYNFVFAGHAYGEPGEKNEALYPPFVSALNGSIESFNPSFIVFGGDTIREPSLSAYKTMREQLTNFDGNIYNAPGNHDVETSEDGPLGKLFRKQYGAPYQKFIFQNDLFLLLDTNEVSGIRGEKQLDFIAKTLSEINSMKPGNIFIFTHNPIWWDESLLLSRAKQNTISNELLSRLIFWQNIKTHLDLIKNRNILILSGDVGRLPNQETLYFETQENLTLISSSMGRQRRDNYLEVTVKNGRISFNVIVF